MCESAAVGVAGAVDAVSGNASLDTPPQPTRSPAPTYQIQINFVSPKDRAATPLPEVGFVKPGSH